MNHVVIIFVPTDLERRDIEAALHDFVASQDPSARPDAAESKSQDADEFPMWTWFIPNPCP